MYTNCDKCIHVKTYETVYFKGMKCLICQLRLNKAVLKLLNWWKEGQEGDRPARGQRSSKNKGKDANKIRSKKNNR